MTEVEVVKRIVAGVSPETRANLSGVVVLFRDVPIDVDIRRGCTVSQRAYFYGTPLGSVEDDDASTALPPQDPARGEIVVFRRNFPGRVMTAAELEKVLLHEIAHALGCEEDEMSCLGLAAC